MSAAGEMARIWVAAPGQVWPGQSNSSLSTDFVDYSSLLKLFSDLVGKIKKNHHIFLCGDDALQLILQQSNLYEHKGQFTKQRRSRGNLRVQWNQKNIQIPSWCQLNASD
jgi:hypothetical protein